MNEDDVKETVEKVVDALVVKDYNLLYQNDYKKLLSSEEIKIAVEEYGEAISTQPSTAFDSMDIYVVSSDEVNIDFDLWYNSKRSDLTLSINLKVIDRVIRYSIEGIHIL